MLKILPFSLLLILISCGSSSSSSEKQGQEYVGFEGISEEFNPRTSAETYNVGNVERVRINLFGFNKNFQLSYSDALAADEMQLKLYMVSKGSSYSIGNVSSRSEADELVLSEMGNYACKIRIKNGEVSELQGACYVKIQVVLPTGSRVEVYNAGQLYSQRFVPMSFPSFMKEFESASFDRNRMAVIADFKTSHRETNSTFGMTTEQLSKILKKFSFDKFQPLQELQAHVLDRENLGRMIDDCFGTFQRAQARQIVGI